MNYLTIFTGIGLVGLAVYDISVGNYNGAAVAFAAALGDFGLHMKMQNDK